MPATAAILGVHLLLPGGGALRVGTLTRDAEGNTAFSVDEAYLQHKSRPILSLSWFVPDDEAATKDRLVARAGKIGLQGYLPSWFAGLLPEGALRQLVIAEMGAGKHDDFDVLARLGADLPGAVMIVPETDLPVSAGPLKLADMHGFRVPVPQGVVKFSLAGVQLKFSGNLADGRLTIPARTEDTHCILKVPTDRFPNLPEAEYAAMQVASLSGVNTAVCNLIPVDHIDNLPGEFLEHGKSALVVERFDRSEPGKRIHIEDFAQIFGAVGDRKYTMANYESILKAIKRFSTDWHMDVMEGLRRLVVDVLIGNGDNHLKNWSFIFPAPDVIRLSPAYDIVPTVLYVAKETLALECAGTRAFESVTFKRIARISNYLALDVDKVETELKTLVREAVAIWPGHLMAVLGEEKARQLTGRFEQLALVREVLAD
jgi:serine/threonine-protein kinase HipA